MTDGAATRFLGAVLAGAFAFAIATPALAQDNAPAGAAYLDRLRACQTEQDPTKRLACYDGAVGGLVAASDAGDVRLLDQEDMRQTRRRLFGFSLPRIRLFGNGEDEPEIEEIEILESTVTRVRQLSSSSFTFAIADGGAVWQVNNAPARLRMPEVGDAVVFKKASLGSYFIRIDGQLGVKGQRIQ